MFHRLASAGSLLLFLLAAAPAKAGDAFEIQVYQSDINRPGQLALELHSNYIVSGHTQPAYEGEIPAHRLAHFTLEPALGVTEWLELGAYIQMMTGPDGTRFGGFKLRTKFVVPERISGRFMLGINAEIGRVPRAVEAEGWANEFRPILGWYDGRVLVGVNPIFGYSLTGPDRFRPDLEPAAKVGVNTDLGFMLGAEYYAGLGVLTSGLSPLRDQEHLLFATFDLAEPKNRPATAGESPWELNVGVGRSLTDATPARWIVKAIVGRAF